MNCTAPEELVIPWNALAAKERARLIHDRYVLEGSMIAYPLCLPGASLPILHDESQITALATTGDGMIFGGTSGHQSHLFVAMFHGSGGGVLDLGVVKGATHCAAIVCGAERVVACLNGPDGGRLISRRKQELPYDMIQEWDFEFEPAHDLGQPFKGERIMHAVADASRRWLVGMTEGHLFRFDMERERIELLAPLRATGRLGADGQGNVYGLEGPAGPDSPAALWRYDCAAGKLTNRAVALPKGEWSGRAPLWTSDPVTGRLYLADGSGIIFPLVGDRLGEALGQVDPAPILTMAATADGRIFGMCGEGICRLFCLDIDSREVRDLACVASVLQDKRYGYQFADAVLGRDGQVIFGEDDNDAHLWLYFPRVRTGRHAD